MHVFRVDEHQRNGQKRRQGQQHVAGHAPVRGVDAHLAENLEPLAHDVGEVVENLREVAAGLSLDEHGGREEPHVDERHPDGHVVQRVLEGQAVVLLLEGLAELRAHGLGAFVGDHAHRRLERVAGLDGARQQIERLWELLLEPADADGALPHEITKGTDAPQQEPRHQANRVAQHARRR